MCARTRLDQTLGKPSSLYSSSARDREKMTIGARMVRVENQVCQSVVLIGSRSLLVSAAVYLSVTMWFLSVPGACLSLQLFICLSVCNNVVLIGSRSLLVSAAVCLSVCLSVTMWFLSVPGACLSLQLFTCLSVCNNVVLIGSRSLLVSAAVYLSVCL